MSLLQHTLMRICAHDCQVYGETSFELVSKMLEAIPLNEDDSFIDLGSGMLTPVYVELCIVF